MSALGVRGWFVGGVLMALSVAAAAGGAQFTGNLSPGTATVGTTSVPEPLPGLCAAQPRRVVSAALDADELLLLLLPLERWAGVSSIVDWQGTTPDAGKVPPSIPRTGGSSEQLLALAPELVLLGEWNDSDTLHQLRGMGVCVRVLPTARTLESLFTSTLLLGQWLGLSESAEALVRRSRAQLASFRRPPQGQRVLLLSNSMAGAVDNLTLDCLEHLGLRSALPRSAGYLPLGGEALLALDPELIILGSDVPEPRWLQAGESSPSALPVGLLSAAQRGRVLLAPEAALASMTYHALELCGRIAERLSP